jgi:protein Tex
VVKVGQVVKVKVLEVNVQLKRVSLTMKTGVARPTGNRPAPQPLSRNNKPQPSSAKPAQVSPKTQPAPESNQPATLADLQRKFGKKN